MRDHEQCCGGPSRASSADTPAAPERRAFLKTAGPGGAATDRVYEFAYMFAPLPLKGATGSPGRPVAIV